MKGEKHLSKIFKSIAFGAELSGNQILSFKSCCKTEVLLAASFSPFHRLSVGSQLKKEPKASHLEVKVHILSCFLLSIVLAHLLIHKKLYQVFIDKLALEFILQEILLLPHKHRAPLNCHQNT